MPSTNRTLLTSTSNPVCPHASTLANGSCAQIKPLTQLLKKLSSSMSSSTLNIHLVLAAPSCHDLHYVISALSPPAPAHPDQSLVQVKQEKTPISLEILHQSQSLLRVKSEPTESEEGDEEPKSPLAPLSSEPTQFLAAASSNSWPISLSPLPSMFMVPRDYSDVHNPASLVPLAPLSPLPS